ncbi:hypothetical protein V1460_09955 [Streptomyces sp. SCSIO 30461]|uniref:hypothetical protein n=1 Tax=Streptomyces sp. SCSIO 30461 TaxID=3118085 RepID=UPI0030D155DD
MGKQRLEIDPKPDGDKPRTAQHKEHRLDLSVPQVAGSALAAVAAAVLASRLGVYGTIVGAGVVSVVATCGATVLQHLFRRTGEQIRDVAAGAGPGPRRSHRPPREARPEGQFGEPTVHGTRLRGWKRPLSAAVVVFVVAMVGITAYEVAVGRDLSGGGGTTVGSVVSGGGAGRGGGGGADDGTPPADGATERRRQDDGRGSSPGPSGDHTGPGRGESGSTSPAPGDRDTGSPSQSPAPTRSASPDGGGSPLPPSAGEPAQDEPGDTASSTLR